MNPNSHVAYAWLGKALTYAGRSEEAIDTLKKGARLAPLEHGNIALGSAYREAGRYEEAINEFKIVIKYRPNNIMAHQCLAGTYALAGRYEEAREAWSEVKKLDPRVTVEKMFPKPWPYGPKHRELAIANFRKAGLE